MIGYNPFLGFGYFRRVLYPLYPRVPGYPKASLYGYLIQKKGLQVPINDPQVPDHNGTYLFKNAHTLNWVGAEGGTDFLKIPKFSQKIFQGGDNLLLSSPCPPPPHFALRGGQFFSPRGGGPDPDSEAEGGTVPPQFNV